MNAFTLSVRHIRATRLPVHGIVSVRHALRSIPARSLGIAAAQAEQRACSRWENEGGAIRR
jgi:hypothetical protein